MGVISHLRKNLIEPPNYDPRNIVGLLDKYRDARIIDSGWREVDSEEWVAENYLHHVVFQFTMLSQ